MHLVRLMWRSTSESKPVHSRYSRLSQAWRTAEPIRIISAVSNWSRRRTSHELNSLNSIRLMWRSTSESKPVHSRYSRLSQAWRTAEPIRIISAVSNWFRRRTSHELNSLNSIRLMWSTASEPGLTHGYVYYNLPSSWMWLTSCTATKGKKNVPRFSFVTLDTWFKRKKNSAQSGSGEGCNLKSITNSVNSMWTLGQ